MTTKPRTIARAADAVRRPTGPMTPTSVALQVEFIEDVRRRVAETIKVAIHQCSGSMIRAASDAASEGETLDPEFILSQAESLARDIRRIGSIPRRIGSILNELDD